MREYGKNIVITFYHVTERVMDESGKERTGVVRITHTWMKTKARWRIVGGMGAMETNGTGVVAK